MIQHLRLLTTHDSIARVFARSGAGSGARVPAAILLLAVLVAVVAKQGLADEKEPAQEDRTIALAMGKVKLTAPAEWKKKKPRSRIVEFEFAVPMPRQDEDAAQSNADKGKPAEDKTDGRLTIMSATGGVEPNIERWIGQFTQPDGKPTKDRAKIEKHKVHGHTVHYVDVAGTFLDRPTPLAQEVEKRADYRLLAAIIETEKYGLQFIKFTGPKDTVSGAEKQFKEFLESLRVE